MPTLLPIILTAAHIVLTANRIPEFNIEPSCRAVVKASVVPNRYADACKRDELTARDKLNDQWKQFTPAQRACCASLTELGGCPSYVELLTCLELAKVAKGLPPGDRMTSQGASN
jgi:hypothetical protein